MNPPYLWCSNSSGDELTQALAIHKTPFSDRREKIQFHNSLCEHFLSKHWKKWEMIMQESDLMEIVLYLLSFMEESFGIRTVLLKGNHRVMSSFMWANITLFSKEPWVPEHLRLMIQALERLENSDESLKEQLALPPSTYLCKMIILPLFDLDLTSTFGRRDNTIRNGSRVEHDFKLLTMDAHSRRFEKLSEFSGLHGINGLNIKHGVVWINIKKFPTFIQLLHKLYFIFITKIYHDHADDAVHEWEDYIDKLFDIDQLESLGKEIQTMGLDRNVFQRKKSEIKYIFGFGEILGKSQAGYKWISDFDLKPEMHAQFLDWDDEKKDQLYISVNGKPTSLSSHLGLILGSLISSVMKNNRAVLNISNWITHIGQKYFLVQSFEELYRNAHLSHRDGEISDLGSTEWQKNILWRERKTSPKHWNDYIGDMNAGITMAVRVAINDKNKNVALMESSNCIQNVPGNGLGRRLRWLLNAHEDYNRGLVSFNRVNGHVIKQGYHFYKNGVDMQNVILKNGRFSQQMNFQRLADVISRNSDYEMLGDIISFTFVFF